MWKHLSHMHPNEHGDAKELRTENEQENRRKRQKATQEKEIYKLIQVFSSTTSEFIISFLYMSVDL